MDWTWSNIWWGRGLQALSRRDPPKVLTKIFYLDQSILHRLAQWNSPKFLIKENLAINWTSSSWEYMSIQPHTPLKSKLPRISFWKQTLNIISYCIFYSFHTDIEQINQTRKNRKEVTLTQGSWLVLKQNKTLKKKKTKKIFLPKWDENYSPVFVLHLL